MSTTKPARRPTLTQAQRVQRLVAAARSLATQLLSKNPPEITSSFTVVNSAGEVNSVGAVLRQAGFLGTVMRRLERYTGDETGAVVMALVEKKSDYTNQFLNDTVFEALEDVTLTLPNGGTNEELATSLRSFADTLNTNRKNVLQSL